MMGKNYIHPPVLRTNAIMMNKYLKECLDLWIFIEGYESAGYSMLVQEDLEKIDEGYLKELYSTLALQYLIFRHNIHNDFDEESTLDSRLTDKEIKPKVIDSLEDLTLDEFNVIVPRRPPIPSQLRYGTLTPEDKLMLQALDIALDAVDAMKERPPVAPLEPGHIPEPEPVAVVAEDAFDGDVPVEEEPEPEAPAVAEVAPVEAPADETKEAQPVRVKVRRTPAPAAEKPHRGTIRVSVKHE